MIHHAKTTKRIVAGTLIVVGVVLVIVVLVFNHNLKQNPVTTAQLQKKQTAQRQERSEQLYVVVHIADGDTIDINKDGKKIRLRLLGINSPESDSSSRKTECYGNEASAYMKDILSNRSVSIKYDPQKPTQDEYGRHLVYVARDDGLNINQHMIETGNAYEYTYHGEGYQYQQDFKDAAKNARTNGAGLWASETCGGKKIIGKQYID